MHITYLRCHPRTQRRRSGVKDLRTNRIFRYTLLLSDKHDTHLRCHPRTQRRRSGVKDLRTNCTILKSK